MASASRTSDDNNMLKHIVSVKTRGCSVWKHAVVLSRMCDSEDEFTCTRSGGRAFYSLMVGGRKMFLQCSKLV